MYGVLYALTPELFPTRDRGVRSPLLLPAFPCLRCVASTDRKRARRSRQPRLRNHGLSFPFRCCGLCADCTVQAPIIALYANLTTSVPIYISGALFLVSGFIALLLPFESRGRASL